MKQDRTVGIGILVFGSILFWETFSFRILDWEPLGMAFWPRVLLGLFGLIGVYFVIRGNVDEEPAEKLDRGAFVALAFGVAYIVALEYVGFLLLTPVFLFVGVLLLRRSRVFTRRTLTEAAIVAGLGTAIVYVAFQKALLVQLPEGLLG